MEKELFDLRKVGEMASRLFKLEAELGEMSSAYLKLNKENGAGKYRIAELLAENEKLNAAYDLMEKDFERAKIKNEKLKTIQPCGHSGACISSTDEGTSHCEVCAEIVSPKAAPIEEIFKALWPRCCHTSGMHDPLHFKEKKYVCQSQKAEAFDRVCALLGVEFKPKDVWSDEECGWCVGGWSDDKKGKISVRAQFETPEKKQKALTKLLGKVKK